ncbi:MAG: FAD-dependent oxidoreductase [Rhodobiaceae bacterium]|nr:FAD-dependent oxidoreductase [Rhodobiaceae bacterium]
MSDTLTFTFDGRTITARPGQSLAAALTDAGILALREGPDETPRGIFCGMGVCQDCLVEVDGRPNRRACMTKADSGQTVRTQSARPALEARPASDISPETATPDVLVIGGGAGGLSAAIAAANAGADVLVLDERKVPGGQFFKQRGDGKPPLDRQQADGAALFRRMRESGARLLDACEVWGAFEGPVIYADRDGSPVIVRPKALVVATGAYERPRFIPGWDLPGVMTTGAAQTLWRSYGSLPGKRVAVFGNGPLNFQVADELQSGGAKIVAVAEAAASASSSPGEALAMALASPELSARGLATIARLRRNGVTIRYRTVPTRIEAVDGGLQVTLEDASGRTTRLHADAVCMNFGFHPQNEILRLLGAGFDYDARRGQLICRRTGNYETTVAGVFAIGDCCGLGGAPAAQEEGTIAGEAAAAMALGRATSPDAAAQARLARHRRFQKALWAVFAAPVQTYAEIAPEALVCRCEGITRADMDGPASEPGIEIGGVKRATRAGMGRCQGRYCAHVLAPRMADALGRPMDERGYFAPRVPVRPIAISAVMAAEETQGGD